MPFLPPNQQCQSTEGTLYLNKTQMPEIATLPYQVPKPVAAKGDFGHVLASKQHADDMQGMTSYL